MPDVNIKIANSGRGYEYCSIEQYFKHNQVGRPPRLL